jgi:hypothetical protein
LKNFFILVGSKYGGWLWRTIRHAKRSTIGHLLTVLLAWLTIRYPVCSGKLR